MIAATGSDARLLPWLAANSTQVRRQLDTALEQQSTGKVADTYAGLGTGVRTSLDLRPAIAHQQVWQSNIDAASGRLEITQSVLKQIAAIASEFHTKTNTVNEFGTSEAGTIGARAKQALQQVAQLLNTKSGDTYIFAGQDTAVAPIPDTDPAVLTTALLASDTATPPFSATLPTTTPTVEVGEGQFVQVGVLANRNTLATSAAPTTGSYLRDVMRALATLSGVTDNAAAPATAAATRLRLSSAIGAMADEQGALGNVQRGLQARKTALGAIQTSLDKQVSNAEDVDMAATLTRISALQTQLQASYQVIAGVRDLSLAKYL